MRELHKKIEPHTPVSNKQKDFGAWSTSLVWLRKKNTPMKFIPAISLHVIAVSESMPEQDNEAYDTSEERQALKLNPSQQ